MGDNMREDAEFTGFFFKRLAYVAKDGSRTAPLLLAKTATWTRSSYEVARTSESSSIRGMSMLVGLMILFAAAVAVGLSALVYWGSQRRPPSHAYRGSSRAVPEQFAPLNKADISSDDADV